MVAVGAATAAALRQLGVEPAFVGGSDAREAVKAMAARWREGEGPAWIVGVSQPSDTLMEALAAWGGPVRHWAVYQRLVPAGAEEALREAMPVAAVLFASGSAVHAFADRVSLGDALVVVIGEPTAAACRSRGLAVDAIAARPSMEALVEAAAGLLRK